MAIRKRKYPEESMQPEQTDSKKARQIRLQKIRCKKRKQKEENNADIERETKRYCLNTDLTHSYLFSSQGMVSFTPEYIQHLKESYPERSYLGTPKYSRKYGEIKIPPYRNPPEFLANLLNNNQNSLSRHFMQKIR